MADQTTLYRLYDCTGTLLYIGIADNWTRRISEHKRDKSWWSEVANTSTQHFDTRAQALEAERRAIATEHPVHNVQHATRDTPAPRREPSSPRPTTALWRFRNRESGYERVERLHLNAELSCSPISDNYDDSMPAHELFDVWVQRYEDSFTNGLVGIYWSVEGENTFESAPLCHYDYPSDEDFLTYFTWPTDADTGQVLNWLTLDVSDCLWRPGQYDKGGFIQEVTGWKPAPLQPYVALESLAAARWKTPGRSQIARILRNN